MKIIISPAKKMNVDTDTFACKGIPEFLSQTQILMDYIKALSYDRCKSIWKCNDSIARQNYERFTRMDLTTNLTPAILSYEGIQYQYMAPFVMEQKALDYLQSHLRILSGFYGMVKPFDGIVPYRLEMQARFGGEQLDSLYEFWGNSLWNALQKDTSLILNLASREYSKSIAPYLTTQVAWVTCIFGEEVQGKIIEKGTFAKMARGEMVRFLAENQVETVAQVCEFNHLGYTYSQSHSNETTLVFLKTESKG